MALAQEPRILLLDEPTTFLDLSHQLEVLDLLRSLNREDGTTIVAVLHDLNLAARYADELVVMAEGASSPRVRPPRCSRARSSGRPSPSMPSSSPTLDRDAARHPGSRGCARRVVAP